MAKIAIISQSREYRPGRILAGKATKAGHSVTIYNDSLDRSDILNPDAIFLELETSNFDDEHGVWILFVRGTDGQQMWQSFAPDLTRGQIAEAAMKKLDESFPPLPRDAVGFV
ncbi:MAG: hypothetical protein Q7S26_00675 [bacterium]|nr:hypothetical protein [bacterium]